jgi:isoquinoline 1-oxidoreductase beta subunit
MTTEFSRRDFLKTSAAGAGFLLTFRIAGPNGGLDASAAGAWEPNVAFTIDPSGIVTVHITKAEMGQGVGTALAQIVAEELEADWKDVRIDYPTSDPKYGLMITGGSWSVNWTFDALSRAGAGARQLLVQAAAKSMGVDPAECVAENSRVRHLPTGRNLSYGDIVSKGLVSATLSDEELKKIQLKKPSEYKIVGRWIQRLDIPEKTNGRAKYGIDRFLPGMVYAKVAYPPVRTGCTHKGVDDSAAKQVKGYIRTVVTDDLVAVVADSYENAVKARDALKVTWDLGPNANVSTESIMQTYWDKAKNDTSAPSWVDVGDVNEAFKRAIKVHEAAYWTDYVGHAPLEPMNCVARFQDGVFDFFSGSQFQTRVMGDLSKKFGVDATKIRVHQQYLGGGFGRRLEPDVILEAGIIAKEVGKPVKLIRSREEDMRQDFYRSCTLQLVKGGLDSAGAVIAWQNALVAAYPSDRYGGTDKQGRDQFSLNGSDHYYDIPNQFVRAIRGETGMEVGYVRAVAPNYTFFAVETFIDELAHLAGVDPLAFRLQMLGGAPRLAGVLKLVADKAGWDRRGSLPKGVGLGIAGVTAQEKASPTWTATVLQARVDSSTGNVKVEKIWCAVDCGLVINPDGVRNQMEGSLLFGMSNALKERATVKNGAIVQSNFHDYQILRMNEIPDEVNVYVTESREFPTGVGEPGVTTILPALSNAIFAASGARVRTSPYTPDRVMEAIRKA